MLNDIVSYEIAKLLNNCIYGNEKYAAENLEVTWDNFLCKGKYKEGELIEDGDNIHGKYLMAPTIAEVIDWLFTEKHIVFNIFPSYTFSTKEHVAFYIKAYTINEENSGLELFYEDDLYMYSINCAVETILKKILLD